MIKWFRNAGKDEPKVEISPVKIPSMPKSPKSLRPKKPKTQFRGPKSPSGYKRRLYIPKRFIVAQEGAAVAPAPSELDETLDLLKELRNDYPAEGEEGGEGEEDSVGIEVSDPVEAAIRSLESEGITNIAFEAAPHCCEWCTSLNGRTWSSADSFAADKHSLVKHHTLDTDHLAHPNCLCHVVVRTQSNTYKIDSTGSF